MQYQHYEVNGYLETRIAELQEKARLQLARWQNESLPNDERCASRGACCVYTSCIHELENMARALKIGDIGQTCKGGL